MFDMEALKKMIEENAEKSKKRIIEEIEKLTIQAERVIDKAFQDAISKIKEIEEEYERKKDSLNKMIISNAEIEVRNSELRLFNEYVEKAIEGALKEIKRNRKRYLKGLEKMFEEAILSIGEKKVIVYCNPEDKEELEKISKKLLKDKEIEVEIRVKEISAYGGVISSDQNETIIYNNTIESRLMRMREDIRKVVGEVLRHE